MPDQLTDAKEVISKIELDFKRIDLVLKAHKTKAVKITPALLEKLNNADSVDDLLCQPSTSAQISAASSPAPSVASSLRKRRGVSEDDLKVKHTPKETSSDEKCSRCGCRMLRVVDPGRPDDERILECTRSSCLASVKFTDLPLGTVVGKEPNVKHLSIYNSQSEFYPDEDDPDDVDSEKPLIFEQSSRGFCIDVPGQEAKARIMG